MNNNVTRVADAAKTNTGGFVVFFKQLYSTLKWFWDNRKENKEKLRK